MDVQSNENADHLDGHIDFSDDISMNEAQEDDGDDKIHDMVEELYVAEEEGNKKKIDVCSPIRRDEAETLPWCSSFKIFFCGEVTSYKVILSNKQCCIHCITKVVIISIPELLYSLFLPGSKETYSCVGTRI
jgi:hypothetical protein